MENSTQTKVKLQREEVIFGFAEMYLANLYSGYLG